MDDPLLFCLLFCAFRALLCGIAFSFSFFIQTVADKIADRGAYNGANGCIGRVEASQTEQAAGDITGCHTECGAVEAHARQAKDSHIGGGDIFLFFLSAVIRLTPRRSAMLTSDGSLLPGANSPA